MKGDKYEAMFRADGLTISATITGRRLSAPKSFQGPSELLLSGYCTPVENQGAKPWCAAYAASSFAENVLWRRRGYHRDVDPAPLYAWAKRNDGDPDGDGTLLELPLKALAANGILKDNCAVRLLRDPMSVKYAIHRYGVCVAGFDVTSEWFNPKNGVVKGGGAGQGGHAVTVCGYDPGGFVILNSWGADYAHGGFVYLANGAFDSQFIYGACMTHVLDE